MAGFRAQPKLAEDATNYLGTAFGAVSAVLNAAMQIQTNVADLVLAGGAESMSQVEYYSMGLRWGVGEKLEFHDRLARGRITSGGDNYPVPGGMLETAENLAKDYGIPREEQDGLFERFYRGSAAEHLRIRGTGLGLALCKEIITRHNGRIWAESEGENAGATFGFTLPAMQ